MTQDRDGGPTLPDAEGGVDVDDLRDSLPDVETVTCGDELRGGSEVCDGDDLGGQACADLPGFSGGALGCLGDCTGFDTSGCVPVEPGCGNQVVDLGEVCDGADLDGLGCADFGYAWGDLWCAGDCSGFLMQGCYPDLPFSCGDGALNGEWCDGADLAPFTPVQVSCFDLGFTGGTLACDAYCNYDTSSCIL